MTSTTQATQEQITNLNNRLYALRRDLQGVSGAILLIRAGLHDDDDDLPTATEDDIRCDAIDCLTDLVDRLACQLAETSAQRKEIVDAIYATRKAELEAN